MAPKHTTKKWCHRKAQFFQSRLEQRILFKAVSATVIMDQLLFHIVCFHGDCFAQNNITIFKANGPSVSFHDAGQERQICLLALNLWRCGVKTNPLQVGSEVHCSTDLTFFLAVSHVTSMTEALVALLRNSLSTNATWKNLVHCRIFSGYFLAWASSGRACIVNYVTTLLAHEMKENKA